MVMGHREGDREDIRRGDAVIGQREGHREGNKEVGMVVG